jgi:two-component system, OmpR family, response regulator
MAACRVLLIEDDAGSRDALGSLLSEEGYEVRTASSGKAGLELARDFEPDTIISDYFLPDLDGLEVLRRTRAMRAGVFFIILTADCGGGAVERVLRREADLFLEKPVNVGSLSDALRGAIKRSPAAANALN